MTTATLLFLQSDMARLLAQTGWVARGVLLILLAFSVFSWAIIYRKHTALRRARAHSDKFLEAFRAAERLPEARPLASAFPASPLMVVYVAAMKEFESQVGPATITPRPRDFGRDIASAVAVAMQLASSSQVARLERWMSFLATTGSVTPFIGLFGTVWGIIGAFIGLGEAGATTLRAVAPGIAEALVTTAAGLFAAIPAVVAYNYFLQQIRTSATEMDNFALEFLSRAEKLYT